jgi:beta-1,4-mannosyl-glycoprotein beta-1,4-N-acetylglucosaminyltransferase
MLNNKKIYDCIPFYQSNLLFELRLKTLDHLVDKFIVCEATKTHAGEKKELCFDLEKFQKITDKIEYIVVDDMPNKSNFKNEKYPLYNYQINALSKGISNVDGKDLIMVSDEDEIPNPESINNFDFKKNKYGIFMQKIFYYKLNIQNESEAGGNRWPGSRICFKENLKKFSWFRALKTKNKNSSFWKFWKEKKIDLIKNGGWHFTYLMDYKKISNKIKASEHSEFNKPDFTDINNIKYRVESLLDPFDRNFRLNKIDIDDTYPRHIVDNQEYYKDWILR